MSQAIRIDGGISAEEANNAEPITLEVPGLKRDGSGEWQDVVIELEFSHVVSFAEWQEIIMLQGTGVVGMQRRFSTYLESCLTERGHEQWAAMQEQIADGLSLQGDVFTKLVNQLTDEQSERPTLRASGSSGTRSRGSRRSTGGSGSQDSEDSEANPSE